MELLEGKMLQIVKECCETIMAGKWICGFSKWLRVCSAYVAEVWGVLEGLKMAQERGL